MNGAVFGNYRKYTENSNGFDNIIFRGTAVRYGNVDV